MTNATFKFPCNSRIACNALTAKICFNGRTAARLLREMAALGYEVAVLPSTSPANAGMRVEEKLERRRVALVTE